jgi:cytochrome P450
VSSSAPLPPKVRQRYPGEIVLGQFRDEIGLELRLAREYGDTYRHSIGPFHVSVANHPDAIEQVLVSRSHEFKKDPFYETMKRILGEGLLTSEGEFHKKQRRQIQPIFHHRLIEEYGKTMVEFSACHRERWREGQTFDLHHELMALTLAVVGKTLFGADVERDAGDVGEALSTILGIFDEIALFLLIFFAGTAAEYVERLPLPSVRRFHEAIERLDAVIFRLIREKRAAGADGTDLLSRLLHAQKEGSGMSDQQVRDEAITIFLAGHETTSVALTWTFYLLSRHTAVEEKLHAELDEVLGERLPTVDDLDRLTYTRKVLSESMRLYPPVPGIGREALSDVEINGHLVPKGTSVFMSQFIVHRDPRWYPEPRRFDPERWEPEEEAKRPKYSYFPFGGGSRICIGESFAWMEGVLVLATLAQRWKLRLVPGHPVALDPKITLRPRYGMRMTVSERLP